MSTSSYFCTGKGQPSCSQCYWVVPGLRTISSICTQLSYNHKHTHTHTHTHTQTCIHTNTHTHKHTQTCTPWHGVSSASRQSVSNWLLMTAFCSKDAASKSTILPWRTMATTLKTEQNQQQPSPSTVHTQHQTKNTTIHCTSYVHIEFWPLLKILLLNLHHVRWGNPCQCVMDIRIHKSHEQTHFLPKL